MAEYPTAEQLESVLDTTVQWSAYASLDPLAQAHRKFVLDYSIMFLSLVIALVGLVGNSIILWMLGFHTQRSPFSIYILNFAGSKALFLGTCLGSCIWEIVGNLNSLVLVFLGPYILHLSYCVGLSLLAVIKTERCLSVLFPICYRCYSPNHTFDTVCAILWTLSSLFWGVCVALNSFENDHFYVFYRALPLVKFWWFILTCVLWVSSLTLVLRVQCSSQCRRPPRLYFLILLALLVFLPLGLHLGIIDAMWFL